jgi:hypothetical protein
MTGATVQLAKVLRETGLVVEHQTTESIIQGLRTSSADLVSIIDRLRAVGRC